MFFKKIVFSVLIVCFLAIISYAEPLTTDDKNKLTKIKHIEHILYESYLETDDGIASVFGYQFDTYFTDNFPLILAIYGAVGGDRGGYGIAAFGTGWTYPINKNILFNLRFLTGSGGGGGLDAGGGFMWALHTGINYKLTPSFALDLNYGYLKFPTGTFETPILNLGISLNYHNLFLPFE